MIKGQNHSVEDFMLIFYKDFWLLVGTSAGMILPWLAICLARPRKCG